MTLASFTYGLGVLCVVLTTVAAGEKIQFVFRIFLLSIKVKSTVKCCQRNCSIKEHMCRYTDLDGDHMQTALLYISVH